MSGRRAEILRRRRALHERIATQRGELAQLVARCEAPLRTADIVLHAARFVRAHPGLLVGVAALIVLRRRGLKGVADSALRLGRLYLSLSSMLR
jgi:YqjK-like protein